MLHQNFKGNQPSKFLIIKFFSGFKMSMSQNNLYLSFLGSQVKMLLIWKWLEMAPLLFLWKWRDPARNGSTFVPLEMARSG